MSGAQNIWVVGYHWNRLDEHMLNPWLLFTITSLCKTSFIQPGNKHCELYYQSPSLRIWQMTNLPCVFFSLKEQREFEKKLFEKTHKSNSEILMYDGLTVVYKSSVDLFFYVLGSSKENEILLTSVLNCIYDSISQVNIISLINLLLRINASQTRPFVIVADATVAFPVKIFQGLTRQAGLFSKNCEYTKMPEYIERFF